MVFFDNGIQLVQFPQLREVLPEQPVVVVFNPHKTGKKISGRPFLVRHFFINLFRFFVAPNQQRVKPYFSTVNFMNGAGGQYQPEKISQPEMQPEKREKKLVVVFVGMNVIVENQRKKNDDHTHCRGKESLSQLEQPRPAVNIIVKSGDIVEDNPEYRNKKEAQKIAVSKFYGNIDTKPLGFYNRFPVDVECGPAT